MQEFFEKPMFTIPVVRNHAVSRMGMQLQFSISFFCFPLISVNNYSINRKLPGESREVSD